MGQTLCTTFVYVRIINYFLSRKSTGVIGRKKKNSSEAGFFGTVTYKGVTFSSLAVMGNNFFPGQY